jgi:hypothetical protein
MYVIEWEDDSSGLKTPLCNGKRVTGSFPWLPFAERANKLEAALQACWELVPDGTEHPCIPLIKRAMWNLDDDAAQAIKKIQECRPGVWQDWAEFGV